MTGSLVWPTFGRDVICLFGVLPASVLLYVDPGIPPPMNAWLDNAATLDKLFFTLRTLYRLGEQNLCYLSSIEYVKLIRNDEDVCLLDTFA